MYALNACEAKNPIISVGYGSRRSRVVPCAAGARAGERYFLGKPTIPVRYSHEDTHMTTITPEGLALTVIAEHLDAGTLDAAAVIPVLRARLARAAKNGKADGFRAMRTAAMLENLEATGSHDLTGANARVQAHFAAKRAAAKASAPAPASVSVDAPALALTTAQARETTRATNFIAGLDADTRDAVLALLTRS